MLRSILVGLDGSASGDAALQLGIGWAQQADALLVGLGVIDEPTIAASAPTMLGGPPYADPLVYRERMAEARRQVEQLLGQFSLRCTEAGVSSKLLEDVGLPADRLVLEAQRYDLILLGQRGRFHFVIQDRHDETLTNVLKESPRPVVVVPAEPARGRSVVVAYDGSLPAARALHAFVATCLGSWGPAHVVCVADDRQEAARRAERAMDYLRSHAIRAESHPLASPVKPAGVILEQVRDLDAQLVVMGAYGQPAWHEFFLGSATRTVLHESPVPVFLYH